VSHRRGDPDRGLGRSAEWPGNIRQLANAVQAGVIRAQSEGATVIAPRHLLPQAADAQPSDGDRSFHDAVREYQKELLLRALTKHDWNVSEAAVTRSWLARQ